MRPPRGGRTGASMKASGALRRAVAAGLSPWLALAGCSFAKPPPPVQATRLVAVPPQQALDRARHWLHAQGFAIEKDRRRRDGGRLDASRQPFDEKGYARCAWAFAMSGGAAPAADVTVLASVERRGWTRIRTDVDISLENGFGDRAECASTGRLEQQLLDAVARDG